MSPCPVDRRLRPALLLCLFGHAARSIFSSSFVVVRARGLALAALLPAAGGGATRRAGAVLVRRVVRRVRARAAVLWLRLRLAGAAATAAGLRRLSLSRWYVLQFIQARVVTMQLADRTGRSQWKFVSQQACGDQLMRQMLPEYLRQFLLVAAADEYFRECTRTGFPFIMEDVPGHKTFLTLSETTGSIFAALDASTMGKESFAATVPKKPPEFLQRPPVVRSFDFPARRGARPTMVHTAQGGRCTEG